MHMSPAMLIDLPDKYYPFLWIIGLSNMASSSCHWLYIIYEVVVQVIGVTCGGFEVKRARYYTYYGF